MAIGNPADIGYGISITFGTGFFAQITDFSQSGWARSVIDISSNASPEAYRIFVPGDLKDPGEVAVEINFLTTMLSDLKTMLNAPKEACTITYPIPDGGTTAGTIACQAFMSNCDHTAPMDDRMVGNITLKLSDEPTVADAA